MKLSLISFLIWALIVTIVSVIVIFHSVPKAQSFTITHIEKPVIPLQLQKIGFCESGNHQFNPDGSVKRGKVNPLDIGKFQINLKYHGDRAAKMGFDLFTEQGNTDYALWLYKSNGSNSWNWSRSCWSKE